MELGTSPSPTLGSRPLRRLARDPSTDSCWPSRFSGRPRRLSIAVTWGRISSSVSNVHCKPWTERHGGGGGVWVHNKAFHGPLQQLKAYPPPSLTMGDVQEEAPFNKTLFIQAESPIILNILYIYISFFILFCQDTNTVTEKNRKINFDRQALLFNVLPGLFCSQCRLKLPCPVPLSSTPSHL